MPTSSFQQDKHAVVFGGGGSIGAAVAREFASEGAEAFLAGRTPTSAEAVAKQIEDAGGRAHADVVDALDAAAAGEYFESVVQQARAWTSSSTRRGPRASEYANGKHAVDLPADEFMVPVDTVLKAQFITAAAAARQMLRQGSGVIIFRRAARRGPTPQPRQASVPPSVPSRTSPGTWRSNSVLPA
jgi:3-oxoacyl-[acyl-carrier protein] reductase